jgi:hypothetical protein
MGHGGIDGAVERGTGRGVRCGVWHAGECRFGVHGATGFDGTGGLQEGYFPVNYPNTWLRLRRSGMEWEGYASLDNRELDAVGLGFRGFGARPWISALWWRASMRIGPWCRQVSGLWGGDGSHWRRWAAAFEPLLQSSRLTPLVISEIMYHPVGAELEFVELANTFATAEDLSGYRLSGEIDFVFPPGTVLAGGAFVVVARDPAALRAHYGITNVLGTVFGRFVEQRWYGAVATSDGGGVSRGGVWNGRAVAARGGWGGAFAGAGTPSYGRERSAGLGISDVAGGSPGRGDSFGCGAVAIGGDQRDSGAYGRSSAGFHRAV